MKTRKKKDRGPLRRCFPCTECCTALGVEELDKPEGQACEHECAAGCGIYDKRPESCRAFKCLWRDNALDADMRPDESGLLVYVAMTIMGATLHVRELVEGACETHAELLKGYRNRGPLITFPFGGGNRRVSCPQGHPAAEVLRKAAANEEGIAEVKS